MLIHVLIVILSFKYALSVDCSVPDSKYAIKRKVAVCDDTSMSKIIIKKINYFISTQNHSLNASNSV